jgi:hypothetical protein
MCSKKMEMRKEGLVLPDAFTNYFYILFYVPCKQEINWKKHK